MIDNREEFCWPLRDEDAGGVIFCAETGILGSVENIHTDE